jgi:hypothetical protein
MAATRTRNGSRRQPRRRAGALLLCAAMAAGLASIGDARAQEAVTARGQVRAVVIGVDAYRSVPRLRGAVADAGDLSGTLRKAGVSDISVLVDAAATRPAVLEAMAGVVSRAQPDDLVVLAFAGHAVREPQHGAAPRPGGLETAYVLAGYDPAEPARAAEKLIDSEIGHVVRQLEAKGARALVVADTCASPGTGREVDSRGEALVFRGLPATASRDALVPVADDADSAAMPGPFPRSTILMGCDTGSATPEVVLPGVPGPRGALSHAVARVFEGHGDADRDGRISEDEFLGYVRQVTYQMSAQRQIIVSYAPAQRAPGSETVAGLSRGILVVPKGGRLPPIEATAPPPPPSPGPTVRIASTGDASLLANLNSATVTVETVSLRDGPELIWDPATGDVLAGADVIARRLPGDRLRGAVERTIAVRKLKQLSLLGPETIRLLPDDRLYKRGSRLSVRIEAGKRGNIVVFNIAGDGTVQLLYPQGQDPRRVSMPFELPKMEAQPPFGSDTVVVVASEERLTGLAEGLSSLNNRQLSLKAVELVERLMPAASGLGLVTLFTAP